MACADDALPRPVTVRNKAGESSLKCVETQGSRCQNEESPGKQSWHGDLSDVEKQAVLF